MFKLLSEIRPEDVLILAELKRGKTGSRRIAKHRYPRAKFGYSRYKVDPRPDVLVLGDWKHPNTKNHLKAGINLHYLSPAQLTSLRKIVDSLFRRRSLRSRYRFLRSKLPDVAQYYRTYDVDYINQWQPDELHSFELREPPAPEPEDERAKEKAEKERVKDKIETGEEEPEDLEDDYADRGREAWAMKRQMYDPETGRRNRPEREKIRGATAARRAKSNRYKKQRRELQDLEREAELERIKAELDKEEPEEPEETEPEWPSQAELGDVYECKDYFYSPRLGFMWSSPESYIKYHSPHKFHPISGIHDVIRYPYRAIYNAKTGQTILDVSPSRHHMIFEAGWDDSDVVTFERTKDGIVVKSFCPKEQTEEVVQTVGRGIIPLLLENQR